MKQEGLLEDVMHRYQLNAKRREGILDEGMGQPLVFDRLQRTTDLQAEERCLRRTMPLLESLPRPRILPPQTVAERNKPYAPKATIVLLRR